MNSTEIELFESTNTKALWVVTKKEKLRNCYTEMTNLLQFGTNVRKSQHQPECTLRVKWEDRVLYSYIWVDLHVSVCGQQHPKYEWAIRLVFTPFFLKLRFFQTRDKNLMELDLEIQFISVTVQNQAHYHMNLFFSEWPLLSSSKTLTFLPESPSVR